MAADPRVAHCIFCDDIRFEAGGKISLMGVYAGELHFHVPAPAVLPTFAVVAFLLTDLDDIPQKLRIRVTLPGDVEILNHEIPVEHAPVRAGAIKSQTRLIAQLNGIQIAEEGDLAVYIDSDAGSLRAGRLTMKFGAPPHVTGPASPTEQPQPSRQSSGAQKKKAT